jgi:hypothetical protein
MTASRLATLPKLGSVWVVTVRPQQVKRTPATSLMQTFRLGRS